MLSPYRINSNNTNKRTKKASNTNFENNSHTKHDLKRPQLTSNDLKTTSNEPVENKKNKVKGGANNEINEKYLDEIVHSNYLKMNLAIQIIANDKTVRSDTVQDLKEFNSQSLATQAKKGEQLVSIMPAFKKAFNFLGDDIVERSTENDALKNKIGSYNQQWLEDSKNKLLKQINDEKRANLIMSTMKKQVNKQ